MTDQHFTDLSGTDPVDIIPEYRDVGEGTDDTGLYEWHAYYVNALDGSIVVVASDRLPHEEAVANLHTKVADLFDQLG